LFQPTAEVRRLDRDARTVPLTDQFVDFLRRWGLRSPYVLQPDVTHGSPCQTIAANEWFSIISHVQIVATILCYQHTRLQSLPERDRV
jgi:hypothetical protein